MIMDRKESIPNKADEFSKDELEKLKSVSATRLLNFLLSHLEILHKALVNQNISSKGFENRCIVATSELNNILSEDGFETIILEGDLETGPKNWLVHRVNIVKIPDHWVIIDLTVSQLPWFKNRTWLVETTLPDDDSLKKFLKVNYHWWIRNE